MHQLPSAQAAPAQQTSLVSPPPSQHESEAEQLYPEAVSDARAAAYAAEGSHASAAQSQASLLVAGSSDQHAGLPVTMAALPAPALPSLAPSNGLSVGGNQLPPSEPHGLAALAQQYQQKHRLAGSSKPVEYLGHSALVDEQAATDSNGWRAENPHSNGTLQPARNSGRDAATAQYNQRLGPGQSFRPSSWVAEHNATGICAPSIHDVPPGNGAQTDVMSTQQASAATGPSSVTRKRPFDAEDSAAHDSILAKKQQLTLSGVA